MHASAEQTSVVIVGENITLKKLNYNESAGKIKLSINSSSIAAGAILTQEDSEGKNRPVLYKSIVFSPREAKYSQSKLELCAVAKILKKLQTILLSQHFQLCVDAKCLIGMINNPSLPNAPMNQWIAFIQLFSYDLVHVPAKEFLGPDGSSRRPPENDKRRKEFDKDEVWIKPHPGFGTKEVFSIQLLGGKVRSLQEGFYKYLEFYLTTMNKAPEASAEEFKIII